MKLNFYTPLIFAFSLCCAQLTFAQTKPVPAAKVAEAEAATLNRWLNLTAPELIAKTNDGKLFNLALNKRRITLVGFWSYNCNACLLRLKELRANTAGWANRPFDLVLISTDTSDAPLRDYLAFMESLGGTQKAASVRFAWRKHPEHKDGFGVLPPESAGRSNEMVLFLISAEGAVRKIYRDALSPADWDAIAELL